MGKITMQYFLQNDYFFVKYIPRYDEVWLFGTGAYVMAFDKYLNNCGVMAR